MKIQQTPPTYPPSFEMKYNRRIVQDTKSAYHTIDQIVLDNGNRLSIKTQYIGDSKLTKLSVLYDKFNKWVRSILRYYGTNNHKQTYTSKNI